VTIVSRKKTATQKPSIRPLTAEEQRLVDAYRGIRPAGRRTILRLLQSWSRLSRS
jgi:hypothetical protein